MKRAPRAHKNNPGPPASVDAAGFRLAADAAGAGTPERLGAPAPAELPGAPRGSPAPRESGFRADSPGRLVGGGQEPALCPSYKAPGVKCRTDRARRAEPGPRTGEAAGVSTQGFHKRNSLGLSEKAPVFRLSPEVLKQRKRCYKLNPF